MIRNHIKIAWRNLVKDRQFTLLNLLGLATGLACTFLIYMWVSDEIGMDKFHNNDSRLYQVMQNGPLADGEIKTREHTPDLLAKALANELPGIEQAVVIKTPDADENPKGILTNNGASIKAAEMYVTDNFFKVFNFPLLAGDKEHVLQDKQDILLSRDMAMKLFHTTANVVGKPLQWDRGSGDESGLNGTYVVSGIFENPPANSSVKFDILFSHELYVAKTKDDINWESNSPSTYLLLKDGTDAAQLNAKIKDFIKSKFKAGSADLKWIGTLFLQRYSDKYLHNNYENGKPAGGRIEYVKLFSIIAIFILVIACINFMNLSTAKASRRLKEAGIKKVIGATRATLIFQYISESVLMAFLSLVLAVVLVWLMLPEFKQITGKNLSLNFDAAFILPVLIITLLTGLIAGSYPAFYLSGFKPAVILKGNVNPSSAASIIRKGLVVFQFAASVILIVSVMVVYQQMQLIQNKNLGYNKDNLIHFANDGKLQQNQQAFLTSIKSIPGVVNTTDMEGDMLGNHSGGGGIWWEGKTQRIEFSGLYADFDFVQTMNLKMAEGRAFDRNIATDTSGVIFNETAIAEMGLKNPIGKTVKLWGRPEQIIGVVKDFHFESLYKKVAPFFLSYRKNTDNILVKIKAGTEKQTLSQLATLYKQYNPGLPFEYNFLDEDYQALYASEQKVAVLSRCFAAIAILISCLGLFGLAAFTAQKRQKEIGIRKIVGATVGSVVMMLSKDFLKLVSIAVLIAFPVAWWAMNHWLNSFAYRTQIGAGVFFITGGFILSITLLTISYQAIKAALLNPVKSLKTE